MYNIDLNSGQLDSKELDSNSLFPEFLFFFIEPGAYWEWIKFAEKPLCKLILSH